MVMLQDYKAFLLVFLVSHLAFGLLLLIHICFKIKFLTFLLSPRITGLLFTACLLEAKVTVQGLGSGIILPLQKGSVSEGLCHDLCRKLFFM